MKYLFALILVFFSIPANAVSMTQNDCSWDNPGANPYRGTIDSAVDYYYDIPKESRETLKQRIKNHNPDEIVNITKYGIQGNQSYYPVIQEMHFGPNLVCSNMTRTRWPETMIQKASMYCEGKYCIIVPFICGNYSRAYKSNDVYPKRIVPSNPFPPYAEKVPPTEVPEPSSLLLIGLGLIVVAFMLRKRK